MADHHDDALSLLVGDVRERLRDLADESVQTVVTSPPYFGLRDYDIEGQLGLERNLEDYIANLVTVFREVRRVLKDDGTVWLNLGDSYWGGKGKNGSSKARRTAAKRGFSQSPGTPLMATRPQDEKHPTLKPKDLIGVPWRVAFALQADGWYLRADIIWAKPNPMPESVKDRPTRSHEFIFLFTKSPRYYYDAEAIKEPTAGGDGGRNYANAKGQMGKRNPVPHRSAGEGRGLALVPDNGTRNKRDVWTVSTRPFAGAHFATFPPDLIEPCVLAGSKPGDMVLDPFGGAGTTALVANKHGRQAILIELNPEYAQLALRRLGRSA